jgi:hypothetical protein
MTNKSDDYNILRDEVVIRFFEGMDSYKKQCIDGDFDLRQKGTGIGTGGNVQKNNFITILGRRRRIRYVLVEGRKEQRLALVNYLGKLIMLSQLIRMINKDKV